MNEQTKQNLKTLLNEIWKLGDKDEMSIKHVGHGLAALVAFGDWQRAIDYDRPAGKMTKQKEKQLINYWELVKQNLDGMNRAECVELFESLYIAWYGVAYLEWPEYQETKTKDKTNAQTIV